LSSFRAFSVHLIWAVPALVASAACDFGSSGASGSGGTTANEGTGGTAPGTSPNCAESDPSFAACPDACTALAEATCEVESTHEAVASDWCGIHRLFSFSDGHSVRMCLYFLGDLVGAKVATDTTSQCWGEDPTDCREAPLAACDGQVGLGGASGDQGPQCYIAFSNSCGSCCPEDFTPPDCSDGEPHGSCVQGQCACYCIGGVWGCPC
jgi:hypothetical protein